MSFEEVSEIERLRRLVSISPEFKAITLLATPGFDEDYASIPEIGEYLGIWFDEDVVRRVGDGTIKGYLEHSLFTHQMVVKYKPKRWEGYTSKIVWKRNSDGDKYGVAFAARELYAAYKYDVSHVFALGYSHSGAVSPLHKFSILYLAYREIERTDLRKADLARVKLLNPTVVQFGIEDLRREGLIGVEGKDEPPTVEWKIKLLIDDEPLSIDLEKTGVWLTEKGRKYFEDPDGIGLPTLDVVKDPSKWREYREVYERMLHDTSFRRAVGTSAAMKHREDMRFGRKVQFQDIVYHALGSEPLTPKQVSESTGIRYKTVMSALGKLKEKKLVKQTEEGWVRS
jgi:hypothetical protein